MVYTFICNVSGLLEEQVYKRIYEQMPDFRKEKADRIRPMEDKALSIGAWYLWMKAQEYLKIEPDQVEEWTFNLSHSGVYALCSVSRGMDQVGCDIEMKKAFREGVAKRYFRESEVEAILGAKDRAECFYRFWVLKESFMKATRRGMALGLDTFEIQLGEPPALVLQPEEIKGAYYFKEYQVKDAPIAVCSTKSIFADELIYMEIK